MFAAKACRCPAEGWPRRRGDRRIGVLALLVLLLALPARSQDASPPDGGALPDRAEAHATPTRLSFVDGEVSFWRPGADDWAPARVNTPLAEGDQLYAGSGANLELQVAARAFVRAGSETQLALDAQDPDFTQLRVPSGHVSLDVRGLKTGQSIEIDTPNAAFTVDHTGYYRIEVADGSTTFISRRGGRASVTPAGGEPAAIAPSEEVVVSETEAPQVATYVAPELDAWDRWNYERTDGQIDAVSSRYVPPGVYGADALDQYGSWRVVPTYGSVWIPTGVPVGWAPYSTGRWILDPFYGWTWVDDAPWGWAPFHYGRWVHLGGYWGWAPGPVVVRPYYAPALVAFFSSGGTSFGFGTPVMSWVALGWGEPCHPWWGPPAFAGHPHWFGWGGPRVAINETIVNVKNVNVYQNVAVQNAVVAVRGDHFGRGPVAPARLASSGRVGPVMGPLPIKTAAASFVGGTERAPRPPQAVLERRVVATRVASPLAGAHGAAVERVTQKAVPAPGGARVVEPQPRIVPSPKETPRAQALARPPFGEQGGAERALPPPLPRFEQVQQREGSAARPEAAPLQGRGRTAPLEAPPQATFSPEPHPAPAAAQVRPEIAPQQTRTVPPTRHVEASRSSPPASWTAPRAAAPIPQPGHEASSRGVAREASPHAPRELPGEPANRVYRGPAQAGPIQGPASQAPARASGHGHGDHSQQSQR